MNFKKNRKRFWTLSSAREGFTLVELIVVIAILAILAGVAVPAYSGYVTKANKQADMTLASEVAHALTLYYYAHPEEVTSGYVILTQEGEVCGYDNADVGLAAMDAVFGDGWENTVSLKYDGWSADGVLNAALGRDDIGAINNAPILQNFDTTELLDNIQDLTSSAFEFLGDRTAENKFSKLNLYDSNFVDFCKEQGLELNESGTAFKDATDAQLSNLMGLYAAQHVGNMTTQDYVTVLQYTLDPAHGTENPSNNAVNPQLSTVTLLASQYAILKAISVQDGEEGAAKMAAIDEALRNADSMLAVTNAMGMYFGGADGVVNTPEEQQAANDIWTDMDFGAAFMSDTAGITAMMGAASAASGTLYDDVKDLDTNDFYLTPNVSNAADTIRGVAGMTAEERAALKTAVSNLQDGQILVLLIPGSGLVTISPMAANATAQ